MITTIECYLGWQSRLAKAEMSDKLSMQEKTLAINSIKYPFGSDSFIVILLNILLI